MTRNPSTEIAAPPDSTRTAQIKAAVTPRLKARWRDLCEKRGISESKLLEQLILRELATEDL